VRGGFDPQQRLVVVDAQQGTPIGAEKQPDLTHSLFNGGGNVVDGCPQQRRRRVGDQRFELEAIFVLRS
jgi:hypothetical protein